MKKLDLTKHYKPYYSATLAPEIVDVEAARYLALAGQGDPSGQAFADTIQTLYTTAYVVKFANKAIGHDFVVPKLEGQWWFDADRYGALTITEAPRQIPRSEWKYRLLIRLPDFVTSSQVAEAIQITVTQKKNSWANAIELYEMAEGKSVQVLHVGPFDQEPETLQLMGEYMKARGLEKNGHHHEIYLSDFRKTASTKLRTILREPVK